MTQIHENKNALEYSRNLYKLVLNWYKNADTKAQAVLTLDGALITFITGFVVLNPTELEATVKLLDFIHFVFLILMALSMILSVFCALNSFRSRIRKDRNINSSMDEVSISPEKMLFFGDIASVDKVIFKQAVKIIDEESELTALADQIHIISTNVFYKHLWVNRAFWAFGISLFFLIFFTLGYIVKVAS